MTTIAIAEDHKALSDGLKVFIEQESEYRVLFSVCNGVEMIKRLKTSLPDVILTDISMPEMDGVQLCREVKKSRPHVKIIVLSMFDNMGAVGDMVEAGADGYILKSSPLADLIKAIRQVSEGKTYYDINIQVNIKELARFKEQKHILSRSEREILRLIASGFSSQEIALKRSTATSTVIKHRKNMIHKLGLSGTGELLQYAIDQHGHKN
jgi:two-component system response regulator NreC